MKKERNEFLVGLFVIAGLIFLTLVVFFVSGVNLFKRGYNINVIYDYVSILDRGAPVRMAGVRIGEVSGVYLISNGETEKTRVRVELFIHQEVKVKANYLFNVQGTHILSEPHIEISPQPGEASYLKDGDTVEGVGLQPIEALISEAQKISTELRSILEIVHGAVKDEKTGAAMREVVLNWAELTKSLNTIIGGSEEDLMGAITGLNQSAESLSVVLAKIEKGEGTAGKLLMEDELYQDMKAFVKEIKAHPWRLMKKDGSRGKFLGIF